jgi:hypothetical protein
MSKTENSPSAPVTKSAATPTTATTQSKPDQTPSPTSQKLVAHPLAKLFPPLQGEAYAGFLEDVRKHGVREPITLFEGMILDGVNRAKAAVEAGTKCPTQEYTGNDPLGFVISKNGNRRHLNESQRALVASRIANLARGGSHSANLPNGVSQEHAAKMLGVSTRSVTSAKAVLEKGVPELVRAVEQGIIAVAAAAEVARLEPARQRAELTDDASRLRGPSKRNERARQERKKPKLADKMLGELNGLAAHSKDVTPGQLLASIKSEGRRQSAFTDARIVEGWLQTFLPLEPKRQPAEPGK